MFSTGGDRGQAGIRPSQLCPHLWKTPPTPFVVVLALLLLSLPASRAQPADAAFASQITALSESDGYFDTDNLISNESSYLRVAPDLQRLTDPGGVYIGVGPDQNFSYIARVRPATAFIVDIRRDNLLLHLLFKAIFEASRTRIEYVARLTGRSPPPRPDDWRDASIDRIVSYIDEARGDRATVDVERDRLRARLRSFGVPLTPTDLNTIDRFHRAFIDAGLDLKFQSTGRPPQIGYPTYRDLLRARDRQGRFWNFLANEDDFQFVRSLQVRHRVIPVVGDLAGTKALVAIGRLIQPRGERLSAFYASNVEFYLFRQGRFSQFVENLRQIPHASRSVIIRSVFGVPLPETVPGDYSTSQLQSIDQLLDGVTRGRYTTYGDLVSGR